MKRYISALCLLFAATFLFVSCLDDNTTEITLYDDIAITSFGLSSAQIYKHTTSSTGADSVYETSDQTVSNYPFRVDHQRGEIYNPDSLPLGIDPTRLLCTYTTKNNGVVLIENITGDSLKVLTTTDSTDFSAPRYVYVYASDNSDRRRYKITVNVHKENGDEFRWTQMPDCDGIATLEAMRAVAVGNSLLVLGLEEGRTIMYSTDVSDGATWTRGDVELGQEAYNNVAVRDNNLFVLDGGNLLLSADGGVSFETVARPAGLRQLLGASDTELYALADDGAIAVSTDNGQTWSKDAGAGASDEDETEWLPTQELSFSYAPFRYSAEAGYVVLAGSRSLADHASDANSVVWRKIVEYAPGSNAGKWTYMNVDDSNRYPLPRLSGLTIFNYGSSLLAMGGRGIGACENEPLTQLYESRDGGITWKKNSAYSMPTGLDSDAPSFAATVDANNHIWILCGGSGQVWRGRLNRLGWAND